MMFLSHCFTFCSKHDHIMRDGIAILEVVTHTLEPDRLRQIIYSLAIVKIANHFQHHENEI